jgi:small subunit ribosomal protein S17
MAEKTTTKKTTAAKSTRATARDSEKPTAAAKKTTAAKSTAAATKTASAARAASRGDQSASGKAATAAVAARKAVAVRKRTATTVAHHVTPAGEVATGWRRFRRKTKVGVVVSAKQPKTVIVTVGRMREHPLYKKVVRLRKGFAAHDEAGEVREGDLVRIQESRPYSATKRWKVVEVLSRSGEAGAAAPRVADVAGQLERAEGVTELFAKPESQEESEETN